MLMKLEEMYNTNYFSLLKTTFEIYSEKLNWLPQEALQGKNHTPNADWRETELFTNVLLLLSLAFHTY